MITDPASWILPLAACPWNGLMNLDWMEQLAAMARSTRRKDGEWKKVKGNGIPAETEYCRERKNRAK